MLTAPVDYLCLVVYIIYLLFLLLLTVIVESEGWRRDFTEYMGILLELLTVLLSIPL